MIDKHMFPKDYDFYVVNDGIDRRTSMLRSGKHRRRSSAAQHMSEIGERRRRNSTLEAGPCEEQDGGETETMKEDPEAISPATEDVDMDMLSGAMSSLKFVPSSVRFGRGGGRGRGGLSRS